MRLAAASAARALPARGRTGRPGVRTKSRGGEANWLAGSTTSGLVTDVEEY